MASNALVNRPTKPLEDAKAARNYCIRLLARREYSRRRLIDKLKDRGIAQSAAEEVVAQLATEGLQSDQRCLEAIQRTGASKGWSRRRLMIKMRDQGIDPEILQGAEVLESNEEQQRARLLFDRWMGSKEPTEAQKRKILARLARRGFPIGHLF